MFLRRSLMTLSLVAAFAAPASAQDRTQPATISMQGHGEIAAAPDLADVSAGIVTQAAAASDALAANSTSMAAILAVINKAGIAAKDIQTSGFSVAPQYVYSDQRDDKGFSPAPKIVGYQVSNNVTVRVRDLAGLGTMLDQMVQAGANNINGINFGVTDPKALFDDARKLAMADAIAKAKLYTAAASVGLGPLINIGENAGYSPQPMMMAKAESFDAGSVPVQAGQLTFAIDVSASWEIRQ